MAWSVPMRSIRAAACALALAAAAAGCNSGGAGTTLVSIAIQPSPFSVFRGKTIQLSATGSYSDGSSADLTATATWTSSDGAVATVSAGGLVSGISPGTVTLGATIEGVSGTASGTVALPVLQSISVLPSPFSVAKGQTVQLSATGAYSDGSTANLTATATWTSSDGAVAPVTTTGRVSGTATGTATVTATRDGVSGSATGTVTPPVVVLVTVKPAQADVTAGGPPVSFTASALYSDLTVADVTALAAWGSSAPDQVGVVAGVASAGPGARVGSTASVTATLDGVQGASTATVVRGPAIGPRLGNDPLAVQQWYLENTGQKAYADSGGVAGEDLRLANAYRLGLTGAGVKVAVIDTGLQIGHEDLAPRVVPGSWNFLARNGDPSPSGPATGGDHGTSVSGIVAMAYGNGLGGMGVAPGVGLNGYNLLAPGLAATLFMEVQSLGASDGVLSPRSNDVWIFNQSYGFDELTPAPAQPVLEAQYRSGVTTLRGGRGALYVKSSGNGFRAYGPSGGVPADCADAKALGVSCQNASMDGYATLPYNVVVGALNASGKRSSYSTAGSALWASAPGGEFGLNASTFGSDPTRPWLYEPAMVTTDWSTCAHGYALTGAQTSIFNQGGSPNLACDYANTFNGTSSAAPSTVGAIALLLDARPSLTWREVKHVLASTGRRVDASLPPVTATLSDGPYVAELPWTRNQAGYWFHNWYGFGAVDVDAAVELARTLPAGALGAFTDTGWIASPSSLGLAIPDDAASGRVATLAVPSSLVVEAVQIDVSITHPAPGDLGIELVSPSGTRSILLNIRNGFAPNTGLEMVLETNAFYGEDARGSWTVKVVDGRPTHVGTLDQWKIRVFGH